MCITRQWMPNTEKNPNKRLEVGSWKWICAVFYRLFSSYHHVILPQLLQSPLLKLSIKSMVSFSSSCNLSMGLNSMLCYNRFKTTKTNDWRRGQRTVLLFLLGKWNFLKRILSLSPHNPCTQATNHTANQRHKHTQHSARRRHKYIHHTTNSIAHRAVRTNCLFHQTTSQPLI